MGRTSHWNSSNDFKNSCKEARIKKALMMPYNPQQNGVAERKNKAIIGVAKVMIHDQDLSMFLSAKALQQGNAQSKQESSQGLGGQDSRGSIHKGEIVGWAFLYLRVFDTYRCTFKEEDGVGAFNTCIFVGYNETSKEYRV